MPRASLLVAAAAIALASCTGATAPPLQPSPAARDATLWQRPLDLRSRNLHDGPWGVERAPDPTATYSFVERKHTGVNPGLTVVDGDGRQWSVKQPVPGGIDDEGKVEVTVSRVLSAVGYHQVPVYYLPTFTLKDDWGTHTEVGGRFRLKERSLKEVGAWSWQENPFVGTRPLNGLLVLLLLFNSTDLKNTNNSLYEHRIGDLVEQWYVVRDLGAALGDMNRIAPLKGMPEAFERDPFLLGVRNGRVEFAYRGWYRNLVRDRITPEDLAWAIDLLSQLNDRQWHDAFRAGGFERAAADRFIRKLREKMAEGRTLGVFSPRKATHD